MRRPMLAASLGRRSEGIDGIRNVPKVAGRTWVSLRYAVRKARRRSWDGDDPPRRRTAELPLVGASHNLDPLRFAKSAKHSASIGPNFSVRRAVSEATSVGGLYHYFENAGAMSAFGPKRTFKKRHTMSAFWGKADIGIVEHNDRLWLLSGLSPAIPGKSMSSRPR